MSKPESYYDWQLKFRTKPKDEKKRKKQNKLGIDEREFNKFLKSWKDKNL